MSAMPSLMALRHSLRGATSSSSAALASTCRTFASSLAYQIQSSPSTSQLEQQQKPSSQQPDAGFGSLHAEFSAEQPEFADEKVIAVPSKTPIVHVKLSHLSPASKTGSSSKFVPLSAHVFDAQPRRDVLHSAIVYYLDAQRSGTASTKTRSDIRASKKKLRPQKGSGQARLGTASNPMLRGGAVAHGPRPRDHSTQLPRRVRELALRSALSWRWREGDLHVVPSLDWIAPPSSTGPLARLLGSKGWSDSLFLTAPRDPQPSDRSLQTEARPSSSDPVYTKEQRTVHAANIHNFVMASSNLPRIELIELHTLTEEHRKSAKTVEEEKRPGELHAYEVLKRSKVICDLGAIEWLEEKLGGAIFHEQADLDILAEQMEIAELQKLEEKTQAEQQKQEEAEQAETDVEPTKPVEEQVKA